MKKIKSGFRRTICILLAAVSLSMTVASDYYGARYCEAAEAAGFVGLIESLLLSLGLSCQSYNDLKTFSDACHYDFRETLTPEEIEQMESMTLSDVIDIGKEEVANTWSKLKSKVKNLASSYNKAKNKGVVTAPGISDTSYDLQVQFGQITETQLRSMWNNIPIGASGLPFSDKVVNNGILLVAKKIDWSTGQMFFKIVYPYSSVTENDCKYYAQYDDTFSLCRKNGGSLVSGSSLNTYCISLSKEAADSKYLSCNSNDTGYATNNDGTSTLTIYGTRYSKSFDTWIYEFAENDYSICVYSSLPVYDSYQDFVTTNTAATTFPLAGSIYGDESIGLDDSKPFDLTDGSTTQAIEEAINNAIENNPGITADEINDIVSGTITKMVDIQDSIEEGNQTAVVGNTWLEKIHDKVSAGFDMSISAIHAAIMALGTSVTSKLDLVRSAIVDGTSALQEEVDDIRDQFTVIEGGGGQEPDQGPDPEPEDPIPVWIPVLPAVVKFLKPVLNFFANPLSIITQYLHVYQKLFVGWQEWIKGTYDNVTGIFFNQMPQILNILNSLLNQAIGFPAALAPFIVSSIVEALEKIEPLPIEIPAGIPIEFPDSIPLELPEGFSIPNYMNILQEILNAINNIFALDTVAILAAALALKGVFDGMFPDLDAIKGLFDSMKFSDDYDYPVFKMKNPDVLKNNGIGGEYIILLDFGEYAQYCFKIRGLIRCILWLTFAYTIFGHFKVHFSVE